jgi:hypothetical protein
MVGAGKMLGFYNEEEAANAIDFQTIGLLPGMMLLVALLQPTGFFEYLATLTGSWSRGNPLYYDSVGYCYDPAVHVLGQRDNYSSHRTGYDSNLRDFGYESNPLSYYPDPSIQYRRGRYTGR